jgi:putative ABC transport system permease protein
VAREGFYRNAYVALRAIPGVEEIGNAAVTPLTGNNWTVPFERPEQPVAAGERPPEVGWQVASGGFFKTLGIPLIAGRLFDERDRPAGHPVVVVSQAIQKRFFPNENPVGKLLKQTNGPAEIIGVVGDIRRAGLRDEPRADLYFPFEQNPTLSTTLFVRTDKEPTKVLPALQAALRSVEAKTVFIESVSLGDIAAESVRTTQLVLWLMGVFAVTALVLAAIGIYGVMSYVVRQRTREIGTRIALGATRGHIVWLIMRQGAFIAGVGASAGLLIGVAAARSLNSILYGVKPSDPATMASATTVLVAAILLACYIPARRAAAVDPARTLAEQ